MCQYYRYCYSQCKISFDLPFPPHPLCISQLSRLGHGSGPSGLFGFAITAFEYATSRIAVPCLVLPYQLESVDGFSGSRAGEG